MNPVNLGLSAAMLAVSVAFWRNDNQFHAGCFGSLSVVLFVSAFL